MTAVGTNHDIHVYAPTADDSTPVTNEARVDGNDHDLDEYPDREHSKPSGRAYETRLEPDPLLIIDRVSGVGSWSGSTSSSSSSRVLANANNNCIKWTHDARHVVYPCQAIVIAHCLSSGEQRCFVGHADRVSCIALTPDDALLASGQTGPHSLIRLWDFKTRTCLCLFRSDPHQQALHLLDFSHCGNYLCGVGKDRQAKTMLVMWHMKQAKKEQEQQQQVAVRLVAKAHTDANIARLVFVPTDSSRWMTCGRDNVRSWRLAIASANHDSQSSVRSCALNLFAHSIASAASASSLDFTDICLDASGTLAYASTRNAQIFVINVANMQVAHVRMLAPLVSDDSEVAATAAAAVPLNVKKTTAALTINSLSVTNRW